MAGEWNRMFAFCGTCWQKRLIWVKGNVGHCDLCNSDWHPPPCPCSCHQAVQDGLIPCPACDHSSRYARPEEA